MFFILLTYIIIFGAAEEQPLWRGDFIQLECQEGRLVLTHQDKKPLHQFEDVEILEWEKTAAKLEQVFQKVFQVGDYYRTIPLEEGPAQMTLIPVGAFDQDEGVNLHWKAKNVLWIMGGKKELIPELQQEQIDKIQAAAIDILPYDITPIPLIYGTEQIVAIKDSFELLKKEWEKRFALYHPGEVNPLQDVTCEIDFPIPHVKKEQCAVFCNPIILERQKIFEGQHNTTLINYRPYTDEEHLLIVPKRHIEKISQATDEEILEKYRVVNALREGLEELFPHKKIILLTNAGWKANQTQNHLHDHLIVYDPDSPQLWMYNWLAEVSSLGKERASILSDEEIKERKQRLLNTRRFAISRTQKV